MTKLRECQFYDEIKSLSQITATTDMRSALVKQSEDKRLFFNSITDFKTITESIDHNWKSAETVFSQCVAASSFFHDIISNRRNDAVYEKGYKRNIRRIVRTINTLEEAVIDIDEIRELSDGNKDIDLFCDVWEYVYENDTAIKELHQSFRRIRSRQEIKRFLEGVFENDITDRILLNGFYYLTPLQERFFRILEDAGYTLIFLVMYNPMYDYAMETPLKMLSNEFGFPDRSLWNVCQNNVINNFGEILEGRRIHPENNISLMSFQNEVEFSRVIWEKYNNGISVYSADASYTNSVLRDFYPEVFGQRRLLSYPAGQFLVLLHSMWDEENNNVTIETDKIRNCLASGWLSYNGKPSNYYLRDFDKMISFFRDCKTVSDWMERLDYLEMIQEDSIGSFFDQLGDNRDRFSETAGNPFSHTAYYSLNKESKNAVTCLVKEIIESVTVLFSGSEKKSVGEHIKKLEKVLKSQNISDFRISEEAEIVSALLDSISQIKKIKTECWFDDISSAIHLYLSGALEDEESENSSYDYISRKLIMVDSEAVKKSDTIHICMCDINNLPGEEKPAGWPVDNDLLEKYCNSNDNILAAILLKNLKMSPSVKRYNIFSAFQNKRIEMSWIREINSKPVSQSPYIGLINDQGIPVSQHSTHFCVPDTFTPCPDVNEYNFSKSENYHKIKEIKMEYSLCPMRYIYGYVLDKCSAFSDEFHISNMIGGIIRAVYSMVKNYGITEKTAAEMVFAMFPSVRNIERQQISDYVISNISDTVRDEYGSQSFPSERFGILFPDNEVFTNANICFSKLSSQSGRKGINIRTPADTKKACVYCPFSSCCRNTVFSADQEVYYG